MPQLSSSDKLPFVNPAIGPAGGESTSVQFGKFSLPLKVLPPLSGILPPKMKLGNRLNLSHRTRMICLSSTALVLMTFSNAAADSWRLVSQSWFNLIGQSVLFSPYDYDSLGRRLQRRDYNSRDSSGVKVSHTIWEYDLLDRPWREIAFSQSDTLSVLVRSYDSLGREFQEAIYGEGGRLRYRDSMSFDHVGNLATTLHFSGTGTVVSRKTFSQNPLLQQESDTTWQALPGGGFEPALILQTQLAQGRVSWTQQWSKNLGGVQWNPTTYTEMAYRGSLLASVTNLEADGSARVMLDSTVYLADAYGNRTSERTFNQDRIASTLIQYNWVQLPSTRNAMRGSRSKEIGLVGSHLLFPQGMRLSDVDLMDSKGRRIVHWAGQGVTEFVIPSSIPSGAYLVHAKGDGQPLVSAVTLAR